MAKRPRGEENEEIFKKFASKSFEEIGPKKAFKVVYEMSQANKKVGVKKNYDMLLMSNTFFREALSVCGPRKSRKKLEKLK